MLSIKRLALPAARLILCLCFAVIPLSLCGCFSAGEEPGPTDLSGNTAPVVNTAEQAAEAALRIKEVIPAGYLGTFAHVVSGGDVSGSDISGSDAPGNGTTATDMFRTVALSLLEENYQICLSLAGDEGRPAVDAEYNALVGELNLCTEPAALRDVIAQMDSRLFRSAAIDPAAEGAALKTELYLYTDEEGQPWVCVYANAPLPGFMDAQRGYSLTVFVKSTKTNASADSIYTTDCIRYINEYAVRFRLSDVLKEQITADQLIAGNNRMIFSLFAMDNSYSLSFEHYKWRAEKALHADPLEARNRLVEIISEFD